MEQLGVLSKEWIEASPKMKLTFSFEWETHPVGVVRSCGLAVPKLN